MSTSPCAKRTVIFYGVPGGALIAALKIVEYRSLVREPVAGPFVRNEARLEQLGITPRELEFLGTMEAGLGTREIVERLFVAGTARLPAVHP